MARIEEWMMADDGRCGTGRRSKYLAADNSVVGEGRSKIEGATAVKLVAPSN